MDYTTEISQFASRQSKFFFYLLQSALRGSGTHASFFSNWFWGRFIRVYNGVGFKLTTYKATCFEYNLVIFRPVLTFVLPDWIPECAQHLVTQLLI